MGFDRELGSMQQKSPLSLFVHRPSLSKPLRATFSLLLHLPPENNNDQDGFLHLPITGSFVGLKKIRNGFFLFHFFHHRLSLPYLPLHQLSPHFSHLLHLFLFFSILTENNYNKEDGWDFFWVQKIGNVFQPPASQ